MIRLNPTTGYFRLEGIDEPLEPRMSYTTFREHPACKVMPEIHARRNVNHDEHKLPEGQFEGCRVWGTASFTNGELESLWLQVLPEEKDGKLFRYEQDDPLLLELQERWLREVVGVEPRVPLGPGVEPLQHQRRLA